MFGPRLNSAYATCAIPSVRSFVLRSLKLILLIHRCPLYSTLDIPLPELVADPTKVEVDNASEDAATYVVCRLGNDSQLAVDALRAAGMGGTVRDLIGGLRAWAREVDNEFPVY